MEPEEDREFLDLLENEESDTQKPMTIHHSLETEPTHLEWGIKITIFFCAPNSFDLNGFYV
jgi:hypothetical protein